MDLLNLMVILKTTQELDYENNTAHPFTITAQASDRSDGPGLTGSKSESHSCSRYSKCNLHGRFFISIFNVIDEELGAKVDHRRYFNPTIKMLENGKLKRKSVEEQMQISLPLKPELRQKQKNGDPVEDETEDYLDFITLLIMKIQEMQMGIIYMKLN